MVSPRVPQSFSSTAVAPNLTGKVSPAIKTFESRSSAPMMDISTAPKVSMGANLKKEAPKIGPLPNRSSTCSSAVRTVSKIPPEAGKHTAEGKMKTFKTSGSTDDKLSRSSSEIRILPTNTVGLGSVHAQSTGAHKIMDSTEAPEIKPAPNIDEEIAECKVTSVLEAKLNVDTKPAVSTER